MREKEGERRKRDRRGGEMKRGGHGLDQIRRTDIPSHKVIGNREVRRT